MHEFSLCEGIIKQIALANQSNLSDIEGVVVEIGALANVDIESLCFWFPIVAATEHAQQIKLTVNRIKGLALCNNCQNQFELNNFYDQCSKCGEFANYTLISGSELIVKSFILNLKEYSRDGE